jgi:hypothetical protein
MKRVVVLLATLLKNVIATFYPSSELEDGRRSGGLLFQFLCAQGTGTRNLAAAKAVDVFACWTKREE